MKRNLDFKLTINSQQTKTIIALLVIILFAPCFCVSEAVADSQSSNVSNISKNTERNMDVFYGSDTLPLGIRSRYVENINGLTIHILEAGYEAKKPTLCFASPWFSGTGLQLEEGNATSG